MSARRILAARASCVVEGCSFTKTRNCAADARPPAGVGRLVGGWCMQLDWTEICFIDIVGVDALARHFLDRQIAGLPPRIAADGRIFERARRIRQLTED